MAGVDEQMLTTRHGRGTMTPPNPRRAVGPSGGAGMRVRTSRRSVVRLLGGMAALAVLLAGCDWASFGYDGGNTRNAAVETAITPDNAPTLTQAWVQTLRGTDHDSAPVVAGGRVFVSAGNWVQAFNAKTGAPLWSGGISVNGTNVTAVGGRVYVVGAGGVWVFDAAGGDPSCTGIGPNRTCRPLYRFDGNGWEVVVSGQTAYLASQGEMQAWDATGQTNCVLKIDGYVHCAPIRVYHGMAFNAGGNGAPAVVDNVIYAAYQSKILAFSADGSTGCDQSHVCSPLRTYQFPSPVIVYASPVVADDTLYVTDYYGKLFAADATGNTGCTPAPVICSPTWQVTTGFNGLQSSVAVGGGMAVLSSYLGDGVVAIDTEAAGHPKLWSWLGQPSNSGAGASPAIAGDIVVTTSSVGATEVFAKHCPSPCAPRKTLTTGDSAHINDVVSPTVASGTIYVAQNDQLFAFRLPPG
jgi:outer membrane protein assembly factor BamB